MLRWLRDRLRRKQAALRELGDPFRAEVLLDGEVVALLGERIVTDMFWRSYRIDPVGTSTASLDDELWSECRFHFRDPTGHTCSSGFPGGTAPFVRDGRVSLRAMYFGPPVELPRSIVNGTRR